MSGLFYKVRAWLRFFRKTTKKGQKNVNEGQKGQNIWKFGQKYAWKYFEKGLVIACDYHTQ